MSKKTDSKLYIFFDVLTKLALINVLTIVTSLGVVTLLPSLTAALKTIKDVDEASEGRNLYKRYFINFKHTFKRSFFIGLIITVIVGLFVYAWIYYRVILGSADAEGTSWALMANIGFYFSNFILVVILIILNQLTLTLNYFNFKFMDNFRFTFLMAFRSLTKTFLVLIVWFLSYLLFTTLVSLWFFFGVAGPLYFVYILYKPMYKFLTENKKEIEKEKGE